MLDRGIETVWSDVLFAYKRRGELFGTSPLVALQHSPEVIPCVNIPTLRSVSLQYFFRGEACVELVYVACPFELSYTPNQGAVYAHIFRLLLFFA